MNKTEKKIALITGGGTGLGRAIAITLAKEGYTIAITGRREEKLHEVAQEISGQEVIIVPADVTNEESVQKLRKNILEKTGGRLDLLVNNVGGVPAMGKVAEMPEADWRKVMDTNLTSQFLVTQAFLPELRKSEDAKIISVTSGMAHYFMNGFGAYSASKAAVEALMKTVAEEEKENKVSVELFDPENVVSEGNPDGEKDPMELMSKFVGLLK